MATRTKEAALIGKKIKQLRSDSDWTQSKLSEKSGVTASAISMIEAGERTPSLVVLRKISSAFKVPLTELTGEEESTNDEAAQFFRQFGDLKDLEPKDREIVLGLAKQLKERRRE